MLKIESSRIDGVLDLVGELVVIKSQLIANNQDKDESKSEDLLSLLDKTVRDLYDKSLNMRMVNLKTSFMKLQRTIRDLSGKLNKNIEFSTKGEETELDRVIIDQLGDPLLHICRNSMDHGIEPEDERVRSGIPKSGKIQISAKNRGSEVVITIKDDGRGINRAKVIEKAKKNGVIRDESAMSDEEILGLIFAPGFSTAEVLSDVSGRGVGMDVVKSNIEAMKGRIQISSIEGEGTTLDLILPLTTAITDGIQIISSEERYIIAIDQIVEFVPIENLKVSQSDSGLRFARFRENFIPIISLGEFYENRVEDGNLVVVLGDGEHYLGLQVETLLAKVRSF